MIDLLVGQSGHNCDRGTFNEVKRTELNDPMLSSPERIARKIPVCVQTCALVVIMDSLVSELCAKTWEMDEGNRLLLPLRMPAAAIRCDSIEVVRTSQFC
jgi:hypothetical protein